MIYLVKIRSGLFSAFCLFRFPSVKIKSIRLMIQRIPRKTQLHINPNCLNNTLNISKTINPRPIKIRFSIWTIFDLPKRFSTVLVDSGSGYTSSPQKLYMIGNITLKWDFLMYEDLDIHVRFNLNDC